MAWEVLLSSVADGIIGQLGKAIQNEVALLSGVEDELQKLEDTVSTIKSVLADAEKRQVQEEQIKTWLRRLEDAVYEADDFVDEFSTDQALRSQQQAVTGNKLAKKDLIDGLGLLIDSLITKCTTCSKDLVPEAMEVTSAMKTAEDF